MIKDGEETIDSDKLDCKDMKTCGEIGEYKKKECEQVKDREKRISSLYRVEVDHPGGPSVEHQGLYG